MKLQILSTNVAMSMAGASATAVDCGTVQTIYQNSQCCSDTGAETCAHKLSVSDPYLELDDATGELTTKTALATAINELGSKASQSDLDNIFDSVIPASAIPWGTGANKVKEAIDNTYQPATNSAGCAAATHGFSSQSKTYSNGLESWEMILEAGDVGTYSWGCVVREVNLQYADLITGGTVKSGALQVDGAATFSGVLSANNRFDVNHAAGGHIFRVQERTDTNPEIYLGGRVQFDGGVADFRTSSVAADFLNTGTYHDISTAVSGRPYPANLLSVKVSNAVFAGSYHASSDRRIKRNIVDADTENLLTQVRSIPMRNYGYKDKAGNTVGFIAQELADISETFVSLTRKAIPDIRKSQVPATLLDNKLVLDMGGDENIQVGEVLAIDTKSGQKDMEVIDSVDGKLYLKVDTTDNLVLINGNMVGVYGRVVDDFHTINKDRIMATAVGALQEVDKTQQALLATVAALEARLAALE